MITPAARWAPRRRAWVAPALWLGIPVLLAVGPWCVRQWTAREALRLLPRDRAVQFTGEPLQDRRLVLEYAWRAACGQRLRRGLPPQIVERLARRQADWLAEIAGLMLPLEPPRAEQVARQAIERLRCLPERIGPEDLAAPLDTPTGQLLRLAERFQAVPAIASAARSAALERARSAEWPGGRVYALCLCARELRQPAPGLARAALREAQSRIEQLPGDEQIGARAAVAGAAAFTLSPATAQPLAARALRDIDRAGLPPVELALCASLLAPAAPAEAGRLARQAADQAAACRLPPEDLPFRGAFREPLLAATRDPDRPALWPLAPRARPRRRAAAVIDGSDLQLRRVAAVLAADQPAAAQRAALLIRSAGDRSGSLTELAAAVEAQEPAHAAALYRMALRAADQLTRPVAARRAARVRAAAGLAAYDARAALAVIQPLPPRLIAFELNDLAARLARQDPAAALQVIERGEQSLEAGDSPVRPLFGAARGAVAARLARPDPHRASALMAALPPSRSVEAWITLARALATTHEP